MLPARILPLDEATVNRIAAGEILQRPASFVKEAIENSLDAQATAVSVSVKAAMIQVSDNGKGIHPEDLLLLSRRHSTSKLRTFEDLTGIATYGFRGEALASAMCVAQVTIVTQPRDVACAHKATYREGKILGKVTKTAGTPGTLVTVEDLFFNDPVRLKALKSASEEYSKVLEVVQKYAIHHSGKVSFTCSKPGQPPDLHTLSTNTLRDNVRSIHGSDVARELLDISLSLARSTTVTGAVTNANFSRKRAEFVLFINDRLVECASVKRAVEAVYAELLPKNAHAFVYLALRIPGDQVDVNTHPTKAQVAFLYEPEICQAIQQGLREVLKSANTSRTFSTSQRRLGVDGSGGWLLSQSADNEDADDNSSDEADLNSGDEEADEKSRKKLRQGETEDDAGKRSSQRSKPAPSKQVRTDALQEAGALDKYVVRVSGCGHDHDHTSDAPAFRTPAADSPPPSQQNDELDNAPLIVSSSDALELLSMGRLREELVQRCSPAANELLRCSVFVGPVDDRLSLFQSGNALMLVDHVTLCKELFFQRAVLLFGRFLPVAIDPPLDVVALVGEELARKLAEHRDLLFEYFSVDVQNGDKLYGLPRLVSGLVCPPGAIPSLLRSIAMANWSDEDSCLRFILKSIGDAYAVLPRFQPEVDVMNRQTLLYALKHVVFPAVRSSKFQVPKEFAEPSRALLVQLATTNDLYKVFERC